MLLAAAFLALSQAAAAGAEMAAPVLARRALDRHRVGREHGGGEEQGAVMLPAVEAVAQADAPGLARRGEADGAAEAGAGESVHLDALHFLQAYMISPARKRRYVRRVAGGLGA